MEPVEVYVDGACRNNGHNNPQAGCGVYWGPVHPLNFAETLQGDKQTNNRGELSAAIIALTQAITCKIKWIKITTDSKYVKNGITEWIKEWRVNDWKTTKRKGDREVLNKDLWLTLDYLQQQLTVDWQWVEGHKDNEGNRKADDLAKMGISAETSVWQQMASKWYDEKNCDVLAISCESVSPKNQEESKVVKPQYICKECSQQCKEEEDAIQCTECKFWMHYNCTNLPEYQLFLYESTQRKFTCKFCVDVDEEFSDNFKSSQNQSCLTEKISEVNAGNIKIQDQSDSLTQMETQDTTKADRVIVLRATETKQASCQTDSYESFAKESKSDTSKADTHLLKAISTTERKSSACQTDNKNYQLVDLQELSKSTVSSLQDSFVGAFDRINESVRCLKTSIDDESHLNQKLNIVMKENKRLRAEISQVKPQDHLSKKKCLSCDGFSNRVEKLTRALEKEKDTTQCILHEAVLQKEMMESRMKADASVLQHKVEILNKQLAMQENEVLNLEKRIDSKNNLIEKLENKTSEMMKKISEFQDEILSLKLHNSRVADLQQDSKVENDQRKKKEESQAEEIKDSKAHEKQYTEIVKENRHSSDESRNSSRDLKIKESQKEDIKKVQIVGTSNAKYISLKYIAGSDFKLSKKIKYTLEETKEYFQNLDASDHQDAFILQPLCNDISKKSAEECTKELSDIIDTIESKAKDTKIIVSLGLPNGDMALNRKTEKVNILLKESLVKRKSVHICDNSNLFYRGDAQQGILKEDGLHLSKDGTKLLAKNIREKLHDAFDIPIITYDSTEKEAPKTYNPTYRNSGYEERNHRPENVYRNDDYNRRSHGDSRRWEYDYENNGRYEEYENNGRYEESHLGYARKDDEGYFRGHNMAPRSRRDEERDTYQGYARQDDRFYNRGHSRSPRSRKDEDDDGWGHQRRSYAPYFQQRHGNRRY